MPLIQSLLGLCLALTASGCTPPSRSHAEVAAATDSIFRFVSIGPGIRVQLGEPLSGVAWAFVRQTGHDRYAVRKGTFSGAAAIELRLDGGGRVAAVEFTYSAADEGFEAKAVSYAETLGPPQRVDDETTRVARWEDGRTRFEVKERGGRVTALLRDLPAPPAAPSPRT